MIQFFLSTSHVSDSLLQELLTAQPHTVAVRQRIPEICTLGEGERRDNLRNLLVRKRHTRSKNSALHLHGKNATPLLLACNKCQVY